MIGSKNKQSGFTQRIRTNTYIQRRSRFRSLCAGFTLVELLVSMSVFAIIVTLLGAVFIQSLHLQQRAQNFQQVEENIRLVLETMAKEIRVSAIEADGPLDCNDTIEMEHPLHGDIAYRWNDGAIERRPGLGEDFVPITSQAVEVDGNNFRICVLGGEIGDDAQPRITIFTTVRSETTSQQVEMQLQTTVSQRFLHD